MLLCWAVGFITVNLAAQQRFLVMEYNTENFFDCRHDSLKNDFDFLPDSPRGWNYRKYFSKAVNISKVIYSASMDNAPDIIGLCEVENEYCAETLTKYSPLRELGYEYVMTD